LLCVACWTEAGGDVHATASIAYKVEEKQKKSRRKGQCVFSKA